MNIMCIHIVSIVNEVSIDVINIAIIDDVKLLLLMLVIVSVIVVTILM